MPADASGHARRAEITRPAALAQHEGRDGDAVRDAIIFSAFKKIAVPLSQLDQIGHFTPGKAGVGRDAGVNHRIVALIKAAEIFRGIVRRIIVDRTSVFAGTSLSVSLYLGGRLIININRTTPLILIPYNLQTNTTMY